MRVVDTTHGRHCRVAEWALGLMLIGLRNAGEQFRRLIGGEEFHRATDDAGYRLGELTGRSVGLIGLGHIGRRLIELLAPFRCPVLVYDPYVSKEVALALHVELAPLERVMAEPDVVVCTAPLTPRTRRMLGAAELDLLKTDAVFVNVSRGAIVDPEALIARARRGDIRVSLDVFDPEPIPAGSPIRELSNVFLSPHIAGVTAACRPRFFSFMVDELERFCIGHDPVRHHPEHARQPTWRLMADPSNRPDYPGGVCGARPARDVGLLEDCGRSLSITPSAATRADMTYRGKRQDFRMRRRSRCAAIRRSSWSIRGRAEPVRGIPGAVREGVQHLGIHVDRQRHRQMGSATS